MNSWEMRDAIEQMREANIDKKGLRDTREIDAELAGMPLREQYRAWKELSKC
jgi:hypothetical protein